MAEQNSIGSISVIGVCIVIVIGLQAATLHRLYFESYDNGGSQPRTSARVKLPLQDELRQRFPGMFQTEEETMKRTKLWVISPRDGPVTCGCIIYARYRQLDTAVNQDDQEMPLVQLPNKTQSFYTEDCLEDSVSDQVHCHCKHQDLYSLAVVYDTDQEEFRIDYLKTGTLCRSLNT